MISGSEPRSAERRAPAVETATLRELEECLGDSGPDGFRDVLETFLVDAPAQARAIEESLALGDAAGLGRAAHTLKSTSAALGASLLSSLCREIEEASRAGAPAVVPERLGALKRELAEVLAILRAELERPRP